MTEVLRLPTLEPFEWTTKHIPSAVLDKYGVGMDAEGHVISPHYSPDMELLAYHSRTPGLRDFRMRGRNVPLGLHLLGNHKELIIVEGHTDTYSAATVFPECDVIGLPGSDTTNTLTPYMSRIRKYKRITVMTDDDVAGRKCGDALVSMLPKSKTYRTVLAGGNDVSDYLVSGSTEELRQLYAMSTANKSGRFVTDDDCDKYAKSKTYELLSTGIPDMDYILGGGLGVSELTLLAGYTGTGKSALAQQLAVNVAKSGNKVLYLAGEMTPKQNLDRLIRQWYGEHTGVLTQDEKARRYKEVSSHVLIGKFTDLTLANVTDTVTEAVMDHGVRLIIIDVLSDIDHFLSTDMTHPAKIIKAIHKASHGDERDGVPPCSILCVAHTKGSDEGVPTADDIRGGSVIRQEATCILGIREVKVGDLSNTDRLVWFMKRPRLRDHEGDTITITFDKTTQRYTGTNDASTTQDTTESVRLTTRRVLSQEQSTSRVSSSSEVSVGTSEETDSPRGSDESDTQPLTAPLSVPSESVPPGLLQSTDEYVRGDKGDTQTGGQTEVPTSSEDAPTHEVHVGSSDDQQTEHTGTTGTTQVTQYSGTDGRLLAIQRMYGKHPETLRQHLTIEYKTNNLVRANLTALGYELQ